MLGNYKTPPNIALGMVLRKKRIELNLTQEELSLEADLQRNYISLMELGQNQPTVTTIFKLAYALKLKPSVFIQLVEDAARSGAT